MRKHPPLMEEYLRFDLINVQSSTGKARYVTISVLDEPVTTWIPLACSIVHWGLGAIPDVIDIKSSFYDTAIAPKN